jgi:hypothetical protein
MSVIKCTLRWCTSRCWHHRSGLHAIQDSIDDLREVRRDQIETVMATFGYRRPKRRRLGIGCSNSHRTQMSPDQTHLCISF